MVGACPITAGSTGLHLHEWQRITSDRDILSIIETGIEIEFHSVPTQESIRETKIKQEMEGFLEAEIQKFLNKGIIVPTVKEQGDFFSTVFLREKREKGKYRMIINLKPIKKHIVYRHFKMSTVITCMQLISPHSYMAALDLQDAYYSLKIAPNYQKYLKFHWKGNSYKYVALPMGLVPGPRIFTKVTKPIIATLQEQGFTVCPYLDDMFIVANSYQECQKATQETMNLFARLGFVINAENSITKPTQLIEHLGFAMNSCTMRASITNTRLEALKLRAQPLMEKPTLQQVMSFVGTVESCVPGVETAYLHKYELEVDKNDAFKSLQGKLHRKFTLSAGAIQEVHWWLTESIRHPKPLIRGPTTDIIQSDASDQGWGACTVTPDDRPGLQTQGRWTPAQRSLNINVRELWAAFLVLQVFHTNTTGAHILLQIDNKTAEAYVNKMGGTKSDGCRELVKEVWHWALNRKIWLTAEYLPGEENIEADRLSRENDDSLEWQLAPKIFDKICIALKVQPDIDLFATSVNTQLERFYSYHFDECAVATNAFNHSWKQYNLPYCFCPFSIIPRVMQQLRLESQEALMVVPLWPTTPWFAAWLQMCIPPVLLLPQTRRLLRLPKKPDQLHPLHNQMRLVCALISGKHLNTQDCPRRPNPPSYKHGDHGHKSNTGAIWPDGLNLQGRDRLIPLILL